MKENLKYDAIVIGGSYSGLAAAMSLGRALRNVLVIDGGKPCNRQTPHSHNFITRDGQKPQEIARLAKEQVANYPTIKFYDGLAINGIKTEQGFEIGTESGQIFLSKKLLFAAGLKDTMPDIPGFAECWGISVIHCPYCHGYEVRSEKTGLIGNGDVGFHFAQLISNWTKELTIFTNGEPAFSSEQTGKLIKNNIEIVETKIENIEHTNGRISNLVLKDSSKVAMTAVYARPQFVQHSDIPAQLGCELTEQGLIKVDVFQKTSVPGIFASGDSSSSARALSVAVSSGSLAGAHVNNELIIEEF